MKRILEVVHACLLCAALAWSLPVRAQQAPADAAPHYTGGNRFSCESGDGKRQYCRVDTRGGVSLLRQMSQARCVRGQTWDYDREGVWVDAGCRGEFQTGRGDGARAGKPDVAGQGQVVKCESGIGDHQRRCAVTIRHDASLQRQLSKEACVQGETWGWDRAGIWVDRGCRGVFRVR